MKLPKARQLPSGSWFVRVQVDGKPISITKPTKREAESEAAALKSKAKQYTASSDKTLTEAIDDYISARENVLSPSTIRVYRQIQNCRFQNLMHLKLSSLSQDKLQRSVNAEAKSISAKSLKNAWGLIGAVIADATGLRVTVRLPQVVHDDLPYLTAEQIPLFLEAIKGDPYEIPILLGLSSLRRSEILAVRWEDIDLKNNCIHVHGSAVYNSAGELVQRQENKNTSSRRTVPFIIPQLRDAVEAADKKTEYAATCAPNTIRCATNRLCKKAGLPSIGAHGLRRSFASLCYHLQVPEQITMLAGGWSDIYTMRKIYTKISQKDLKTQGKVLSDFFANCNKPVTEK